MPQISEELFIADVRGVLQAGRRVALFADHDGTSSNLVPDPGKARPLPEIVETLRSLSKDPRMLVGIISGRPGPFLADRFSAAPGLLMFGLYGHQIVRAGKVETNPIVELARPQIQKLATEALSHFAGSGLRVEEKEGLALAIHWRELMGQDPKRAAEVAAAAAGWLEEKASQSGLQFISGKMVVEVSAPGEFSKGGVLRNLANENDIGMLIFAGDDFGDVPAFEALDELAERGMNTRKIVVHSWEVGAKERPPLHRALRSHADILVKQPEGLAKLLANLERSVLKDRPLER